MRSNGTAPERHALTVIARIHSDFSEKFGIPRQSGLVEGLRARIVFDDAADFAVLKVSSS